MEDRFLKNDPIGAECFNCKCRCPIVKLCQGCAEWVCQGCWNEHNLDARDHTVRELVWLRVGDQDDYRSFESIIDAVEEIRLHLELEPKPFVVKRHVAGMLHGIDVIGTSYCYENGISLYWGDSDSAQFKYKIDESEIEWIAEQLEEGCS